MDRHHIILVFLGILLTQCSNHVVRCLQRDVRLADGPSFNKGTIEIRVDNGTWETTCGVNLGITDVIVICRQLGFTGANRAITNTPYGQNSAPTRRLDCNGDETVLSECTVPFVAECPIAGGAACHGDGYIGCFEDNTNDRVLPGVWITSSSISISYCIQYCNESNTANYVYAGVEAGDECFCGEARDDYTRHGVGSDRDCQAPCSGDSTDSCGGIGYIAIFTIHVVTVQTTRAVVSTAKLDEVTSQPSSEVTGNTRDVVTSSTMTTPLSPPKTLQQSGNCSCVGVGVGEGVAISLLISTNIVSVMYILRTRKKQDSKYSQTTHDMTLVKASSSHDKDTGFYHDIQNIRTPVPPSTPAGDSHYSSMIYDQTRGHATDPADTGIPTESTQYSTRIERD